MGKLSKIALFVGCCVMIASCSSCNGTKMLSCDEVETLLRKRYGENFIVSFSEDIPSDNLSDNVWKARVFRAAPQDAPQFEFFCFSTIHGENGGIIGLSSGFQDNYLLEILKLRLQEELESVEGAYETDYWCYPFSLSDVYYSHIDIFIDVSQDNLDTFCMALSTALKRVLEEVPSGVGILSGVRIVLNYHDDNWEEGQVCSIGFTPFYGSDLVITQENSKWDMPDIEADRIKNSCLQRIQQYTNQHNIF